MGLLFIGRFCHMEYKKMKMSDYKDAFDLWMATDGMGLRSLDDSEKGIEKFLLRNPNTNYICCLDGKLIGLMLCGHDGRRAYIYHAVVAKEYRGRGIGKTLLDNVTKAVIGEGIHKIALVVYAHNQLGNKFWEAQGYTTREDLTYRNKSANDLNV